MAKEKYVGQTIHKDLNIRFQNCAGYKGCKLFEAAIKKYGWDNFEHTVLETITLQNQKDLFNTLSERELFWINHFNTMSRVCGYNMHDPIKKIGTNNNKPVICLETQKTYRSIKEAKLLTGLTYARIYACCKNERKSTYGFHWQYLSDDIKTIQEIDALAFKNRRGNRGRPVLCVDTQTTYVSISEAMRETGIPRDAIKDYCTSKIKDINGKSWRFISKKEYLNFCTG